MSRPITIPVRIGSQSRVFGISKSGKMRLLDDRVLAEVSGSKRTSEIMTVLYNPSGIRGYHRHQIGNLWVPTAPKQASNTTSVHIRELSNRGFVSNLPPVLLNNALLKRWFPEQTRITDYRLTEDRLVLALSQHPGIEGVDAFEIEGTAVGPLSFLDGSVVLEAAMTDYFGFGRRLRLYHDGHSTARVGIQHSARFDLVSAISCDGIRTRFLYRGSQSGMQVATVYRHDPSRLFSFERPKNDDATMSLVRGMRARLRTGG